MKRPGLLDLNEAVQHPGMKLRFDVSTALTDEADIDLLEPVVGTLEAISTGNVLLIDGKFKTRMVLECARCTEPIETELEFEMQDEFLIEGTPSGYMSGSFAKVSQDEPEPLFHENSLILDSYIRQGLHLNVPMQVLCSAGWENPCPRDPTGEFGKAESGHLAFESLKDMLPKEEK